MGQGRQEPLCERWDLTYSPSGMDLVLFRPIVASALRIVVLLSAAYLAIMLLAWRFQEKLAFPAPKSPLPDPAEFGIRSAQRVSVTTTDGVQLSGWYFAPDPPVGSGTLAPGLIWFYGNMETVGDLVPLLSTFRPPSTAVLVLDYRGYGESHGKPTEPGLYRDAEAAWDFLATRPEVDSSRIGVYGRSLGSAVALYIANQHPIKAVILDSPFSNARDMANEHYRLLPTFLVRLSLDNLDRIARLDVPVLIFHGTQDEISPIWMGRQVARAASRAEMIEIPGAGHNDTYEAAMPGYVDRFQEFLAQHLAGNPRDEHEPDSKQ